jgi:hypothetical protein
MAFFACFACFVFFRSPALVWQSDMNWLSYVVVVVVCVWLFCMLLLAVFFFALWS